MWTNTEAPSKTFTTSTVDRKYLKGTSSCSSVDFSFFAACKSLLETPECSFLSCWSKTIGKWLCGGLSETLIDSPCSLPASRSLSTLWLWFSATVLVPDVFTLSTVPRNNKLEKRRRHTVAATPTDSPISSLQIDQLDNSWLFRASYKCMT